MLIEIEDDPQLEWVIGACLFALGALCMLVSAGLVDLRWFDPGFIVPMARFLG